MAEEEQTITITEANLLFFEKSKLFDTVMRREEYAAKLESTRIDARTRAIESATQALIHNSRSLPVSQREITPEQITAYANTIVEYVTVEERPAEEQPAE